MHVHQCENAHIRFYILPLQVLVLPLFCISDLPDILIEGKTLIISYAPVFLPVQ